MPRKKDRDEYVPGFERGLRSYKWRAAKTQLLPSERAAINKYVPGMPIPAPPPLPRQERARPKDEEEPESHGTFSMPSGADIGAKRQDEATKVTRPFKNAGRVVKTAGRFGSLRMK